MQRACRRAALTALMALSLCSATWATETENTNMPVLSAGGAVKIDGKSQDWDLSGGIFICGDVENTREQYALWLHTMYDQDNLYFLCRWIDATPLNNPGNSAANNGWDGDCMQLRVVTAPGTASERASHLTAWRGRDGKDVINVVYGKKFDEGKIKDSKTQGAQQSFSVNADGKGYIQEIAIPWKLLTKDGKTPKAGDALSMAAEPNFTIGSRDRLTLKDIFKAGITPDRVFTFMSASQWGTAPLMPAAHITPPPVRLSDGREFSVTSQDGDAVIDWTGLIKTRELLGFKPITFAMPSDGYISLNIYNKDGQVVRQLLSTAFMTKGEHMVKWDGLTTPSVRRPGQGVLAGDYTWRAIYHTGIGLRLRGWACNAGNAPWDNGPSTNWGGDHGVPSDCATDGNMVFLSWSGAEAGQAVVACDLDGNVKWKNTRFAMTGVKFVAADGGRFYGCLDDLIYRLDQKNGEYVNWEGTDSPDLKISSIWADPSGKPSKPDGITARNGKLYISFAQANLVAVVDGRTGKLIKALSVDAPTGVAAGNDTSLYVVSGSKAILAVDSATGQVKPLVQGLTNATDVALDKEGKLYVSVRDPDNQVKVFDNAGAPVRTIGRQGGRPVQGPWQSDGMRFAQGVAVDQNGKVWVAEQNFTPKRVSVWDGAKGGLVKELFGPTAYGATGGTINPLDPTVMVGQGCEWRIDPITGRDTCLGVISNNDMGNARFGIANNGRLYLAVAEQGMMNPGPVAIYERLGAGNYKLRSRLSPGITVWADQNDDGLEQPGEVTKYNKDLGGWITGWYMPMTPELSFWGGVYQVKATGFTACGAPQYDLNQAVPLPHPADIANRGGMGAQRGIGSADASAVLYNGAYGVDHSTFDCYDIQSGKLRWTYPNNFVGVHGSHNAPPPEVGIIRGAYDIAGVAKLPAPVGNIFAIGTNVGEWHILTEDGFYLTRLFEGDQLKKRWPDKAAPGAIMDTCPPGMGAEDFGGCFMQSKDGKVYIQAGKTAFWNLEVVGLESIKAITGGPLQITASDTQTALSFREGYLQEKARGQQWAIKKFTPSFTGDLQRDFAGQQFLEYQKQDDAAVRSAAAWDEKNIYLAWDVADKTPWINGAGLSELMYCHGDTVDFQIGTDLKADKGRGAAVLGDLRLAIGNLQGKPTAVVYRKVAKAKHLKVFTSGVFPHYEMDSVVVLSDAQIKVSVKDKRYVVEAAIPLAALEIASVDGLAVRGDIGVTHGDGDDTVLRSYWCNQVTGLVSDDVGELMMEPRNWGKLTFGQ